MLDEIKTDTEQSTRPLDAGTPSTPAVRPLDQLTLEAASKAIAEAKDRGWLPADLKRYFGARGLDPTTYKAALAGGAVSEEAASVLTQVSITELPNLPHEPNPAAINAHIEWLVEPARGAYDDALIEIAHDARGHEGITHARLFGLDEVPEAVAYAASRNLEGANIYIGAALRHPDTDRGKRASAEDFYVATAVPIDIDKDYDDTRARMAAVCDDGLIVATGLTPERRSQHWCRLVEPCDDDLDFGHAFEALVHHTSADKAVKDAARVMRLGGTVSFPSQRKIAKGYCTELTTVTVNPQARASSLEALTALEPTNPADTPYTGTERPQTGVQGAIERDWTGRVTDGRELAFRDLLLKHLRRYQEETGCDPTIADLFMLAFDEFCDPAKVDNKDCRWTCDQGRQQLLARASNTIRRLRAGRLAKLGLYSIETGEGEADALAARARRAETRAVVVPLVAEPDAPKGPQIFSAADFANRPVKPRTWLVREFIPGRQVTTIDGDGGLGKSTLGLQLGVAAVTGRSWLNQEVSRGAVIIVAAEDDKDELQRRLDTICVHYGVHFEDLTDLHLWDLAEHDPALVTAGRDDALTPTARWQELLDGIERIKPTLVVLDSRADVFGGNEVSRSQARGFIGMLRAIAVKHGIAVVILAHPSVAGMASGSGSSGSTHWRNAVRAALYLTGPGDDEGADPNARTLTIKKSNYGPGGISLQLRWSVGAFVVEDHGHIDGGAPVDPGQIRLRADSIFMRLLAHYELSGRVLSDQPSVNYAPKIFADDPSSEGISQGAFKASMSRLFAAERIFVEHSGPASRRRARLRICPQKEPK